MPLNIYHAKGYSIPIKQSISANYLSIMMLITRFSDSNLILQCNYVYQHVENFLLINLHGWLHALLYVWKAKTQKVICNVAQNLWEQKQLHNLTEHTVN